MNSLDTLKAFRVFAETLNFTHAAELLHLSHQALPTEIQEVSNSLNPQLYLKQGRQLYLTVQGEKLPAATRLSESRITVSAQEKSVAAIPVPTGQGA